MATQGAGVRHRLLAILAADVAGYSLLVTSDDVGTLQALDAAREVFRQHVAAHDGRVIDTAGDSVLAVFDTATGAVSAALAIQQALTSRAAEMPEPQRMFFRIGIHLGDVLEKADGTVYGDGVNIAGRLQALAEPGGVTVSHAVREAVFNRIGAAFDDLGEQMVKNIDQPVHAFRMRWERMAGTVEALGAAIGGRRLRSLPQAWPRALGRRSAQAALVAVLALVGAGAWWWRAAPSAAARADEPQAMSVAIAPFRAAPGLADGEQQGATMRRELVAGLSALEHHLVRLVQPEAGTVPRARYLLEGDLEPGAAGRASLALQMLDVRAGGQIWSQRFDVPTPDGDALPIFRRRIVAAVTDAVFVAEQRRIAALRPEQMDAMELTLRGLFIWSETRTLESTRRARALFDVALRKDPTLVYAWVRRSDILDSENDVDPHPDRDGLAREMDELTSHAITLDPSAPRVWRSRSLALADGGRWNEAVEAIDKGIRLDPYKGDFYGFKAWLMNMMGRPAEALPLAARETALDPDDTFAPRTACEAYMLLGQPADAVTACEKAAALDTDWIVQLFLAAAYANQGDLSKAKAAKDRALLTVPGYTVAQLRAKRYSEVPEYLQMAEATWYAGLRKAGLPD